MDKLDDDLWNRLKNFSSRKTVRLETIGRKTGLSRGVSVFFVFTENRFFVRTSNRTNWGKNLRINNKVVVKIGEISFSAIAEEVKDVKVLQMARRAYRRKYHIVDLFSRLVMIRGDLLIYEIKR